MNTSREIVFSAFKGGGLRAPRQLWLLPWAVKRYKKEIEEIAGSFPDDICGFAPVYKSRSCCAKGDPYAVGEYVDEWGCVFTNVQEGVIGEVKRPIVDGEEWEDSGNAVIPENLLSFDIGEYNRERWEKYGDKFVLAPACPRPFEQLQFIRGTERLYIDLLLRPSGMLAFMEKMHDFYCRLLTKWARTDVDGLTMMDDWGSQNSLLIDPKLWEELFLSMYRDYIDIAHKYGKKMFMHTDGYTLAIIPKLVDAGLDAINAQIFCIGLDKLAQFKGKITFWGEIDRQNILPFQGVQEVSQAVRKVYDTLWDGGHCIAQCEFGAGAKPENVREVFRKWDELTT